MNKYRTFEGKNRIPSTYPKFHTKPKQQNDKNESISSDDIPLTVSSNKSYRRRPSKEDLKYDHNDRKKAELYYQVIEQVFGPMDDSITPENSSGEVDPNIEIVSAFYAGLSGDVDVEEKLETEIYAPETIIPEYHSEESSLSESEDFQYKQVALRKIQRPKTSSIVQSKSTTPDTSRTQKSSIFSRPRPSIKSVETTRRLSSPPSTPTSKTLETPGGKRKGFNFRGKRTNLTSQRVEI